VVRPDAAEEERIAIEQQVVRGDGGAHVRPSKASTTSVKISASAG
jgi:hypothetical protein